MQIVYEKTQYHPLDWLISSPFEDKIRKFQFKFILKSHRIN